MCSDFLEVYYDPTKLMPDSPTLNISNTPDQRQSDPLAGSVSGCGHIIQIYKRCIQHPFAHEPLHYFIAENGTIYLPDKTSKSRPARSFTDTTKVRTMHKFGAWDKSPEHCPETPIPIPWTRSVVFGEKCRACGGKDLPALELEGVVYGAHPFHNTSIAEWEALLERSERRGYVG